MYYPSKPDFITVIVTVMVVTVMVVGFTTTYTTSAYHHLNCDYEFRSWRNVLEITLYGKVCQ